MKVKFDIKDGNSSHNDGVRYTVFEVKEQSEFFNDFSSKKSPAFEEHFQENISGLKLSDENLPNWNDNYIWKRFVYCFRYRHRHPFYYAENTITKSKELMSFDKYKK